MKRFATIYIISLALFFIVCTGINYIVNPYYMFDLGADEIFKIKPEAATKIRIYKPYQASNKQIKHLIVGNSRVEMGLDPTHPFFNSEVTYNLGIPGASISHQLAVTEHIVKTNPIERVIIGVDFIDFIGVSSDPNYSHQDYQPEFIFDYFRALLSLGSLQASLKTTLKQNEFSSHRRNDGFNPARDYIPILRLEGQNVLTEQKLNSLDKQLSGLNFHAKSMKNNQFSPLNLLARYLSNWEKAGIEVFVIVNPYQESYYDMIEKKELLNAFEQWQTLLRASLSPTVNFYDFTGLGKATSEQKSSEGQLLYFWEPAHYKKELGDKMLEELREVDRSKNQNTDSLHTRQD